MQKPNKVVRWERSMLEWRREKTSTRQRYNIGLLSFIGRVLIRGVKMVRLI